MAFEKPGNPRYSVERTPTGMIFFIPSGILGAGIFEFMHGEMGGIDEKGGYHGIC